MRDAPRSIFGRTVDELSDEKLARPDIPAPPIEHGRGERLRFRLKTGDLVAVSNFDLLVGALRRLVSPRTAEAIVEVDRAELRPGDRLRVLVIQRAPAELESFTVSLVCERSVFRVVTISEEWIDNDNCKHPAVRVPRWDSSVHRSERIFREENILIRRGHDFERQVTYHVPDDVEASASSKNQRFEWYFEVDAVARTFGSHTDRFAIVVRPHSYSA